MYSKTVMLPIFLVVLGLIGVFSCHSSRLDLLHPEPLVKILVKGLPNPQSRDTFNLHISGVNLDVNNDPQRSNYFNSYHAFQNLDNLRDGIIIDDKRLSEGKWRIAVELVGWKTACSIELEDDKMNQLVFVFQKDACP